MSRDNSGRIPGPLQASLRDMPPEKRRQFETLWTRLSVTAEPTAPSVETAWDELAARLEAEEHDTERAREDRTSVASSRQPGDTGRRDRDALQRTTRKGRSFAGRLALGAAVMTVLLIVGLWVVNRPITIEVAAGEQRVVHLDDGSVVELNSDTRLRVSGSLRNSLPGRDGTRRVELDGEAYFRVAAEERPFVIETADALVRVTGTEFNVRARTDDQKTSTRVTLVTGSVEVMPRMPDDRSLALDVPGATAIVAPSTQIELVDPGQGPALDYVLAWRRLGFAFTDTPISFILDEVERRFGTDIEPRGGVDLAEPMNLFYSRGVTPEEILNDICFEQNCTYRPTSRGFALEFDDRTLSPRP